MIVALGRGYLPQYYEIFFPHSHRVGTVRSPSLLASSIFHVNMDVTRCAGVVLFALGAVVCSVCVCVCVCV